MTAAGRLLKQIHSRRLHVMCTAHLLHTRAEKVRAHFSDVDNLIVKLNSAVVKNKDRKKFFAAIGYRPQPIVTRWASWLNAAFYYADNLPDVKRIVGEFQGDRLLVTRVKEAIVS